MSNDIREAAKGVKEKDDKCPTCTGEKKLYSFYHCDKHNVCNTCGTHRSKLKGVIAWGTREGAFLCGNCEERERHASIAERQAKGFEHEYTGEVVCPHCGYEEVDSWEMHDHDDDRECPDCKQKYQYERIITCEYSSSKIGEDV